MVKNIKLNKIFLDNFKKEELEKIINNAMVVTENCIIINTDKNYFELNSNMKDNLFIYRNSNIDDTQEELTKDEFMKLYKSSPLKELHHIMVDD